MHFKIKPHQKQELRDKQQHIITSPDFLLFFQKNSQLPMSHFPTRELKDYVQIMLDQPFKPLPFFPVRLLLAVLFHSHGIKKIAPLTIYLLTLPLPARPHTQKTLLPFHVKPIFPSNSRFHGRKANLESFAQVFPGAEKRPYPSFSRLSRTVALKPHLKAPLTAGPMFMGPHFSPFGPNWPRANPSPAAKI
ncbi:hypothetical protein NPIL_423821 [Nephila pilipes]|uniref:Uncharacterized protein n=1 Tax=Nephila pilipes TaxID=299642 RepID=A0A8X6P9E2_NEPPI|nr:hypothetical protein NPIL_423821 [Nephila pilipes]